MPRYWHAWGGFAPDNVGDLSGTWQQSIVGPTRSSKAPMEQWPVYRQPLDFDQEAAYYLPYLCTWDHEPTTEERNSLRPDDGEFFVEITKNI